MLPIDIIGVRENGFTEQKKVEPRGQSYKRSSSFFKPACILIFSGAFFEFYKKFNRLDFLPGAQKKLPVLGHYISSYGLI